MQKDFTSPTVDSGVAQAPSRGGWTVYQSGVIALLLAISAINYMDRINLSIVVPTLMKQYHLPPAAVGMLLSIVNWTLVVSLLFSGPLVDRFHPRRVLPVGIALWLR
jgi:MFS family permease